MENIPENPEVLDSGRQKYRLFEEGPYYIVPLEYTDRYPFPIRSSRTNEIVAEVSPIISNKETRIGTARLMAAAPDLLAALQKLIAIVDNGLKMLIKDDVPQYDFFVNGMDTTSFKEIIKKAIL